MSKSILILETPTSCSKCPFFGDYYSDMCCKAANNRGINYPYLEDFVQKWCPLIPLPEPKDLSQYTTSSTDLYNVIQYSHDQGYNDCLYEIKGENL